MNAKVHPTITCIGGEVVFSYELLGDVVEVDAGIIGAIEGFAQVKRIISKHTKRAPLWERKLLIGILKSSSEAVGVPTLPE